MSPDAAERIAQLYGLPPEQFTPERNALAAQLRVDGDAQAAAEVKALRKPTSAAWAVNQLVRAEPDLVEALLGAGGELRQAHRQAASGRGSAQLRAATEAERAAVEELTAHLSDAIGRVPSAALVDSVRNSLHAASSSDDARELIATGTLTTELRPVGMGPMPARPRKVDARAVKKHDASQARALKAALAADAALQREVKAARRALDRAEVTHERARERVREARAALAEAERERERIERG
ncbi:MAG: hypothetical protein QOJ29_1532 [Thermoleophilaceae bacterium]|nr:hypothetical protein [Thermoleophilaceae bacterium]